MPDPSFKRITIRDPLGDLPDLIFYPDYEGYSRAITNRRKSSGRTPAGVTKLSGTNYPPYFIWQIAINLVTAENSNLFEDYLEINNSRISPESNTVPHLLLVDEFKKTPASASPRWTFLSGSSETRPYQSGNQPIVSGFGIFPVIIAVSENYCIPISGTRDKLSFSLEEIN